jgi:predicted membrane protein
VAVAAKLINSYLPMDGGSKGITNIVLTLLVVGMALWLINTYVPMAGSIKAILNIVVVAAVCIRVLQAFGLWAPVVRTWDKLLVSAHIK